LADKDDVAVGELLFKFTRQSRISCRPKNGKVDTTSVFFSPGIFVLETKEKISAVVYRDVPLLDFVE
jgi:hypothetical protein